MWSRLVSIATGHGRRQGKSRVLAYPVLTRRLDQDTGSMLTVLEHKRGGVAERLKAVVLKTTGPQGLAGSNPASSANDSASLADPAARPASPQCYARNSTVTPARSCALCGHASDAVPSTSVSTSVAVGAGSHAGKVDPESVPTRRSRLWSWSRLMPERLIPTGLSATV